MNDGGLSGSGERAAEGERAAGRTDFTDIATCLGCDYRLRDLPEARCPECGSVFTLDRLLEAQPSRAGAELEK